MAQVFVTVTKAVGIHKPGDHRWVGVPQLKLSKGIEPTAPDSAEAKAEVEKVMSNVPGIALAPIDGTPPHQFEIPNPFRIDREKGYLLKPDGSVGTARAVRWNFRERILDIWKGRNGFKLPERKTVLRDFLKYQLKHSDRRKAFMEYIESVPTEKWGVDEIPADVAMRLPSSTWRPDYFMPDLEVSLCDEIRAWVAAAQASSKAFASIADMMPSMQGRLNAMHEQAGGTVHPNAEIPNPMPIIFPVGMNVDPETKARELHETQVRDFIPGLSICAFPKFLMVGYRDTYPETGVVLNVNERLSRDPSAWGEIDRVVRLHRDKLPAGSMKDRMEGWKYASIAPAGPPNRFDISNPRTYLLDGMHVPTADYWEHVKWEFRTTLKTIWTNPYKHPPNRKAEILVEYLDYHFNNGGNPKALADYVELITPSGSTSPGTGVRTPLFQDAQQKALSAWVLSARKRLGNVERTNGKRKETKLSAPTLASKFDAVPGSLVQWMRLLRTEGLVDEAGRFAMASGDKGKGKLIAAWVAAVEVFGLADYSHGTKLVKALIAHFPGLTGLDRLDKVRKTNDYTATVERYKEALQDD